MVIVTSITNIGNFNVSFNYNEMIVFSTAIAGLMVQMISVDFLNQFLLVILRSMKIKYSVNASPYINFILHYFHLVLSLFVSGVFDTATIKVIIYSCL